MSAVGQPRLTMKVNADNVHMYVYMVGQEFPKTIHPKCVFAVQGLLVF